jgi:mono/diheme cytochrome c family protein
MTKHFLLAATTVLALPVVLAGQPPEKAEPKAKGKTESGSQKAQENYRMLCQACHGPEGKAPLKDMSLADGEWKHGSSPAAITKTINEGVKGTQMLPFKDRLTKVEIAELARLVRSFDPKLKSQAPVKK